MPCGQHTHGGRMMLPDEVWSMGDELCCCMFPDGVWSMGDELCCCMPIACPSGTPGVSHWQKSNSSTRARTATIRWILGTISSRTSSGNSCISRIERFCGPRYLPPGDFARRSLSAFDVALSTTGCDARLICCVVAYSPADMPPWYATVASVAAAYDDVGAATGHIIIKPSAMGVLQCHIDHDVARVSA